VQPGVDVFVIVTLPPTHIWLLFTVNDAVGGVETLIPETAAVVDEHGFTALIVAKKVFGSPKIGTLPQDVL